MKVRLRSDNSGKRGDKPDGAADQQLQVRVRTKSFLIFPLFPVCDSTTHHLRPSNIGLSGSLMK
jgi:hypothetical protein